MEPEVITVATNPDQREGHLYPVRLLAESCRRNGYSLTVLGPGETWKGYGTKLRLVRTHLRGCLAESVVVFVDAYDSVFLPCRDRLLERFRSFGTPIVFSAEKGCWPDGTQAARYPQPGGAVTSLRHDGIQSSVPRPSPPTASPFRYLNSGGYVGYAGALVEALDDLAPEDEDNDQSLFTDYYLRNPDRVSLDHEAMIFQTLFEVQVEDFTWSEAGSHRLRSRLTGSEPCVLHGNGPGRTTFVALAERLQALEWP